MNKLSVLLALALGAGLAHAEFKDGNKLLRDLRSDNSDYIAALGYIMGVSDALRGVIHCPAPTVTAGQIADMVKQHLEASPSLRHLTGDAHIAFVVRQAWPCPNNSKGTRGGA